jgi:hypothetical protein
MKSKAKGIFAGRVDSFNYNTPLNTYKIFWVEGPEGERSGYAKGNEISGKKINIGDQISLTGEWHVDPKYPRYDEQFFFSDYEIRKSRKTKT